MDNETVSVHPRRWLPVFSKTPGKSDDPWNGRTINLCPSVQ